MTDTGNPITNIDWEWFGEPKATKNLIANVAAAFVGAFMLSFADPTLSWRSRVSMSIVTAGIAFVTKMTKRPADIAAAEKIKTGEMPDRRKFDRPVNGQGDPA